jgi:hypothetical protein
MEIREEAGSKVPAIHSRCAIAGYRLPVTSCRLPGKTETAVAMLHMACFTFHSFINNCRVPVQAQKTAPLHLSSLVECTVFGQSKQDQPLIKRTN